MANKFEVQVVALDRFTKTFRDLNNKASKAARPLVNVQRQIGALAREMHLDKAAAGVGKLSDATLTLTRTLGLSLGPLESVLGAGGVVGGLLAAGVGVVALGVNFARTGFEVSRTAQAIGVSTKDLQLWRGAAQLAGVDADVMTTTLAGLGRSLQDMKFGRGAPEFRQAMNILGMTDVPMKNGVVDQVAALEAISRAMSRISDPHVRESLADALHIPPEAIPALMQGAEAMAALRKKAEELGVVIDDSGIKKATEFTTSLNLLKVAGEGAANSLGAKLSPAIVSVMDAVTKRMSQSQFSPGNALLGLEGDQLRGFLNISGIGALFAAVQGALRGPDLTTPDQRTVKGAIGGPAWPTTTRSASDQQMAGQMAFTPAELARQEADEESASNRRELMREIQRTRDPASRAVLEGQMNEIDRKMHLEVTFKGMPAGTTATARNTADNAFVPTRIQYSMPGDGP